MLLRKLITVVAAAALAAGCTADAPSRAIAPLDEPALARGAASPAVPFHGSYRAPVGFTPVSPDVCATQLADVTQGGGQATHLGRFAGETFACVDLEQLRVTGGRFVFTAADGSRLEGSYSLEATPLSPTLLALDGPFTITGGSRRFGGATGGGRVTGSGDLAAGQLVLHFDGRIASSR